MFTTLLNGFSFDTKAIKDSLKGSPAGDRSKYDFDLVLEEVVAMLMAIMDNNLGEKTEEVSQVGASLLQKANQWKDIEATLINTKEKYNNLVDQSSNLFQSAKKIGNSFAELIMAINKCLYNYELLIPLKYIQKGINELHCDKVEKQMNYLIKLFENAFEENICKRVETAYNNMGQYVILLKNLNKNLESEILSLRGGKQYDYNKGLYQSLKLAYLGEKVYRLYKEKGYMEWVIKQAESNRREENIGEQMKYLAKTKAKEKDLTEKVKQLYNKIMKLEKALKAKDEYFASSNSIIDKIKENNQELIEEMEKEWHKKESFYEQSIKKGCADRADMHERIVSLEYNCRRGYSEIENLHKRIEELEKYLEEAIDSSSFLAEANQYTYYIPKSAEYVKYSNNYAPYSIYVKQCIEYLKPYIKSPPKDKQSYKYLKNLIESLYKTNNELKVEIYKSINKYFMRGLFLNYDDESKEWTVRRNIKHQIHTILAVYDQSQHKYERKFKLFGLF